MMVGDFTLEQLRRSLALEVTRADSSFVHSQISARLALVRDLVPDGEQISAPVLEVDRLELTLGLVAMKPSVFTCLARCFAAWWSDHPVAAPTRFRFAAPGEGAMEFTCVIRRDARGRFRTQPQSDMTSNARTSE